MLLDGSRIVDDDTAFPRIEIGDSAIDEKRRGHRRLEILEVPPQSGDDLIHDEVADVHTDQFENEAAVGTQQLVDKSKLEYRVGFVVVVVIFMMQIGVGFVVDVDVMMMTMKKVISTMMRRRTRRRQMIANKLSTTEVRIGPNPFDKGQEIQEEDEREEDREDGEDLVVVKIQRQRALHDVRVRGALTLGDERALSLQREQR